MIITFGRWNQPNMWTTLLNSQINVEVTRQKIEKCARGIGNCDS